MTPYEAMAADDILSMSTSFQLLDRVLLYKV